MTHIWTVTTHYGRGHGPVTFAFNNEVTALRVAHEIDTIRLKYEAALAAAYKYREANCALPGGELDWAKYNQYREDYPFPPDEYVLQATGQKIQVADYTEVRGPLQVVG